jgi:hypothetical protein
MGAEFLEYQATQQKLNEVSGMVSDLNLELDGISSQESVDFVSGLIGVLPGDLSSRASQVSVDFVSGKLAAMETQEGVIQAIVSLGSGIVGIIPTNHTALNTLVGLVSGKVAGIESKISRAGFRLTTERMIRGASNQLLSGEYNLIFADYAITDMKIMEFVLTAAGALQPGVYIDATGYTSYVFPYEDYVAVTTGESNILREPLTIPSGVYYGMYCLSFNSGFNGSVDFSVVELY